jgi:hypothetical protein
MKRSAQEWAEVAIAPLTRLRAEIWKALNDAKDGGGVHDRISWQELVRRWRPDEEDVRNVEARWRRGLDRDDLAIDIMDFGEALEALSCVKDRLLSGRTPQVRRLIYGEPEPADRILKLLHPEHAAGQDISGLLGTWRLVHQQSDGKGFVSWRLSIFPAVEPSGGPAAWFKMETRMPSGSPRRSRPEDIQKVIALSVSGAAHAVGAMFYFIGVDGDHQPVTASFEAPRGQLPKSSFDRAHGLIQRVGSRGIYAARALLCRVESLNDAEIGSFTVQSAEERQLDGLADDIAIISASVDSTGSPAYLVSANA